MHNYTNEIYRWTRNAILSTIRFCASVLSVMLKLSICNKNMPDLSFQMLWKPIKYKYDLFSSSILFTIHIAFIEDIILPFCASVAINSSQKHTSL